MGSILEHYLTEGSDTWMDDDEKWLQAALEKEREATSLLLEEWDRNRQRLLEEEGHAIMPMRRPCTNSLQ